MVRGKAQVLLFRPFRLRSIFLYYYSTFNYVLRAELAANTINLHRVGKEPQLARLCRGKVTGDNSEGELSNYFI